jgi:hypothetical protein
MTEREADAGATTSLRGQMWTMFDDRISRGMLAGSTLLGKAK